MFTFPPHHVISVKVGFQLNKTICDTKFIDNLIRNGSQKRHKRHKRHILALCFPRSARVNRARVSCQKTSRDSIQPMIYLQTQLHSSELLSLQNMYKHLLKGIYNYLQMRKNYIQEL